MPRLSHAWDLRDSAAWFVPRLQANEGVGMLIREIIIVIMRAMNFNYFLAFMP